jgi:hypothetical protein
MRRRIWCELLPPDELGSAATIGVLQRFGLEPIIALPPSGETPAMADALSALTRAGVSFGLWPLLSDEEGYWPSEPTAAAFVRRVDAVRKFVTEAGATVRTIAVDLEPPLGVTRELLQGTWASKARILVDQYKHIADDERRASRRDAIEIFSKLRRDLDDAGIETLAAFAPQIALDFAVDRSFWQAMLRTPVLTPEWSVLSIMTYSSILETQVPHATIAAALVYECARTMVTTVGSARSSLSIGLVGTGKLGNEPIYASPAELRRDVQLARAAGVDDLALFSLEGTLRRGAPEQWLEPYVNAVARAPAGNAMLTAAGTRIAMRTAGVLLSLPFFN